MKKLIIILAILAMAVSAQAADVNAIFEHSGANTTFYEVYGWKQGERPANLKDAYVINVWPYSSLRKYKVCSDAKFEPNIVYEFVLFASNQYGRSPESAVATWTRVVGAYSPPEIKIPVDDIIVQTPNTTINITVNCPSCN